MKNFILSMPTTILFGKGQMEKLGGEIKKYGSRVLLVYGGGSIKKSGLYDKVIGALKDNGIFFKELSGVQPNPRISSVRAGAASRSLSVFVCCAQRCSCAASRIRSLATISNASGFMTPPLV